MGLINPIVRRWCFGMQPTDVWWATSDIGWVVGHSYIFKEMRA